MGRGMEGSFKLILDEVVKIGPLDPNHTAGQFLLGDSVLLHDPVQLMLHIPAQFVEGVPELHLSSEAIYLPDYSGVGHVCDRLVDQELLRGAPS